MKVNKIAKYKIKSFTYMLLFHCLVILYNHITLNTDIIYYNLTDYIIQYILFMDTCHVYNIMNKH